MNSGNMIINSDNIEQYIFQYKEGLLDNDANAAVEAALAANKEWQQLADLYDPSLQLPLYPKLEYSGKEKLHALAKPSKKRHITFPLWSRIAAACAIIVAAILFIRISISTSSKVNIVANNHYNYIIDSASALFSNDKVETSMPTITQEKTTRTSVSTSFIAETVNDNSTEENTIPYTDNLITFICDDEDDYNDLLYLSATTIPVFQIEYTEQLISFDDEVPSENLPSNNIQQPEWLLAINDWFSTLQIARMEFQTDVVSSLTRRINRE